MSARDWGYAPGDSGYEYPDDGDPNDGISFDTDTLLYAKTCYECRADFETWDVSAELCPQCQRAWLRENCPEAFAEWEEPHQ